MLSVVAVPAGAHRIYVANDNHTDYGWNASTQTYDQSMLSELDYYLKTNPAAQPFAADCWWYLRLYQQSRSAADFQLLIDAMKAGKITVPLNPFVTLYGAVPTEAAIRAGYYPGRMERQYGVSFLTAQEMENSTIPWGIASIWAGSRVKYSWKGLCGCATDAPYLARADEVFRWLGPDDRELLMKWYRLTGSNASWGGYAEARANLSSSALDTAISQFSAPTGLPTGLFGLGWDDVGTESANTVKTGVLGQLVATFNASHTTDQAVFSNEVDYFQDLEASRAQLPARKGGFGNEWDLLPATLAAPTAQTRRAVEELRTAEALAAVAQWADPTFWSPHQQALDAAWVDYFKYFEHTWVTGAAGSFVANKRTWAQSFADAVAALDTAATAAVASRFATPAGEDRFAVFNPLGWARTDVADLAVAGAGPYVVTDVATGTEVPSQVVTLGGTRYLRILASNVPSPGYRVYRWAAGTWPRRERRDRHRERSRASYRVTLGSRGEITSAYDKVTSRESVRATSAFNDFGGGTSSGLVVENQGPVRRRRCAAWRVRRSGPCASRSRASIVWRSRTASRAHSAGSGSTCSTLA
ncbi:MAG: hypothetical protein U0807_16510 [Candidatus Binatia bacterium]